ncbi:MAG: FG-GAP repeat protein [Planctomycetota bacterium]
MLAPPGVWADEVACEQEKLTSSDWDPGDDFSKAVSIHGDVVIVGAYRDEDYGDDSGSAYIYRQVGPAWVEEAKLLAPDGATYDFFGFAVDIHGDVAIVGAHGNDDRGLDSGSAYVFRWDGTAWNLEAKLLASDGAPLHTFGFAVDIEADTAFVGAIGHDENGDSSGAVYAFRFDGDGWIEEDRLLASDGQEGHHFGYSISLRDNVAVIGSPHHAHDVYDVRTGAAYFFHRIDGSWWPGAEVLASDGQHGDRFGWDVSLRENVLLVGAPLVRENVYPEGAAYVYRFDPMLGNQEVKLSASDGAFFDDFGFSVSLGDDLALVGAYGSDQVGPNAGVVYPYTYDAGSWTEQATIWPSDTSHGIFFGWDVVTDGELIIVGADYGAYVFEPVACSSCWGDLDGDGSVGVTDFLDLLAVWGTDPGGPPDFDGDGTVGIWDFLELLALWGPCP